MPIRIQTPDGGIAEFPDNTPDETIEAAMAAEFGAPEPAADDSPSVMESQHPHARVGRWVQRNAPVVGGLLSGALTGGASLPAQAIAAAGGGFLGARLRGDDRTTAATEGALQGGATLGGAAVAAAAGKAGPAIYRGLLKPSKAIRDSFGGGDVTRTLMDAGATITRRGADKMVDLMGLSRGKALAAVDAAEQAGAGGVPAKELVKPFGEVAKELRQRVDIGQANELGQVGSRGKALIKTANRTGGAIPLTKLQVMKETAQDAAEGAYRQIERGTAKQLSADDLLNAATARGAKEAIERRVPGVRDINAQTQKYIGGSRALDDALDRSSNNNAIGAMKDLIAIGGGAGIGELTGNREAGLGTGALLALLSRPGPGSLGAIGLDRLSRQQLDQWLRAAIMGANFGQE